METNPLQVPIALLDRFSAPLKRAESKIKKTQARLNTTNEKLAAIDYDR